MARYNQCPSGAAEVTERAKYYLHQLQSLSSDPQQLPNGRHIYNLGLGRGEHAQTDPEDSLASYLAKAASSRFTESLCLKN